MASPDAFTFLIGIMASAQVRNERTDALLDEIEVRLAEGGGFDVFLGNRTTLPDGTLSHTGAENLFALTDDPWIGDERRHRIDRVLAAIAAR